MSFLVNLNAPDWMSDEDLAEQLRPLMPGVTVYAGMPGAPLGDVTMMATTDFDPAVVPMLPNLKVVQKMGAGVEGIVKAPGLPEHVRITRLSSAGQSREIAEYCLMFVLMGQRHVGYHRAQQDSKTWHELEPTRPRDITVAVLGLGVIGAAIAATMARFRYNVVGWSRSPKTIDGVDCRSGADALPGVLAESDYVIAILPSTPETAGLFDARTLAHMKTGSTFINVGRGTSVVDADLIAALADNRPAHAVLDVFHEEPLPGDHPFWTHPKVTVTPHVSGWHVDEALPDVAENYRRLTAGEALLNVVDRGAGY